MLSQYCRRTGISPQGLPYAGESMIKPNQLPDTRLTTAAPAAELRPIELKQILRLGDSHFLVLKTLHSTAGSK